MKPSDWLSLKLRVPKDYQLVCNLCFKFMKINQHFESISFKVTGNDIIEFQGLVHRIFSEYLALVRTAGAKDTTVKEVRHDINVTFTPLLTEKGGIKDLTRDLINHRKSNTMDLFISQLMSPFISFMDARIYDSLNEALDKIIPIFNVNFINWSCQKAGIFPDLKGGIVTPIPSMLKKEGEK